MISFLEKNKDITNFSGFKIKAFSEYFFEIKNYDDLDKIQEIISFSKKEKLQIIFLGSGTNILFAFDNFGGIIIKNNLKGFEINNNILEIYSGELISVISNKLLQEHKNDCFVSWIGLPGTIGGAIIGNAGSFGLEVQESFISAKILDLSNNKIIEVSKDFMKFEYRNSILKQTKDYFLISAKFDISPRNNKFSLAEILETRKKQPSGFTCGSFFKNPTGNFAGKLIEEVSLKGKKIGGAFVSEKHANFIMSDGTATFQDILDLKNLIQKTVFEKFSIKLEEEVGVIFNTKTN